jgi:hypothetical protein
MRIVVKEIDQYKSSIHKDRLVPEFIIYLMNGDTIIDCHLELGIDAKNERVISLFNKQSFNYDNNATFDTNPFVTEITFNEFKGSI